MHSAGGEYGLRKVLREDPDLAAEFSCRMAAFFALPIWMAIRGFDASQFFLTAFVTAMLVALGTYFSSEEEGSGHSALSSFVTAIFGAVLLGGSVFAATRGLMLVASAA